MTQITGDDGLVETLCRHGVGHPNPAHRPANAGKYWSTHTCCKPPCCQDPTMFKEAK